MEILSAIGSRSATGISSRPHDTDFRLKMVRLQTTAVEVLLKSARELAEKWQPTLNLLAANWLREAQTTYKYDQSTSRGPSMHRDPYGNYFFHEEDFSRQHRGGDRIGAIRTADVLETVPSELWLNMVEKSLLPQFQQTLAQLYFEGRRRGRGVAVHRGLGQGPLTVIALANDLCAPIFFANTEWILPSTLPLP